MLKVLNILSTMYRNSETTGGPPQSCGYQSAEASAKGNMTEHKQRTFKYRSDPYQTSNRENKSHADQVIEPLEALGQWADITSTMSQADGPNSQDCLRLFRLPKEKKLNLYNIQSKKGPSRLPFHGEMKQNIIHNNSRTYFIEKLWTMCTSKHVNTCPCILLYVFN